MSDLDNMLGVRGMRSGVDGGFPHLSVSANDNRIGMPNPDTCSVADRAALKVIRDKQSKIVNDHASALATLHSVHRNALKDLQAAQQVALRALRATQDAATHALNSMHDIAHNNVNAELVAFIRAHPGCGFVSDGRLHFGDGVR